MQTIVLALLSATTVGTLGTVVALPVDQTRATAMLQKARRQLRKAQRASLDLTRSTSRSRETTRACASSSSLPLPSRARAGETKEEGSALRPAASRSSTSSGCSSLTLTDNLPQTPESIPSPSLSPLTPSRRTPHKGQPAIAITCPDGYLQTLDLSTPVSPTEVMSPKDQLELGGLSLLEQVLLRKDVRS